jgi:nucleoside-diphosphate-sugar epimerase
MRERRSSRILITGATGFLGSHLAVELLRKGYEVLILARPMKNVEAGERINRLLDWFGVDRRRLGRLHVIEGHLEDPSLGLGPQTLAALSSEVDEIVHCASATSFSERRRLSVEKANVANMKNILAFASGSRCGFFHYISTAYAAGKVVGSCPEELVETRDFTNVYEETKHIAERLACHCCQEEGIRLNIYRPSIVYGNSRNGKTFRFNAVYHPLRTVCLFKEVFEKDIRESGGKRARALGISIDGEGNLHLPIRVEALEGGGINLIPVDFFIDAYMSIMEDAVEGGIFHIVNPKLKPVQALTEYAERFLGVRGIRAVPTGTFDQSPMNGLEILFGQYIEVYRPYLKDERVFESVRSTAILSRRGIECPEFDYPMFSRCMRYALESDWGKNLLAGR